MLHSPTTLYIALSLAKGIGTQTLRHLLEVMGSVEAIFESRDALRRAMPRLPERLLEAIYDPTLMQQARRIADHCQRLDLRVLCLGQAGYPIRLAQLTDAPIVLYVRGPFDRWEERYMLSVVGTRNVTPYGAQCVERLLGEVAEVLPSLVVVSGMAYGIDIAAHRRALDLGVPTLGVMAHGLDKVYPQAHWSDASRMMTSGAIISEYAPGVGAERYHFVSRNRLIAALSTSILVVEAGLKSGSLITAELAASYDRTVLAVPGRITDRYSEGCNKMITEFKARLVASGADIIHTSGWTPQVQAEQMELNFATDTSPDHPLLRILSEQGALHQNDLLLASGMSLPEMSAQLFELELDGHVRALPGGLYALA